jgi:hypothetical protein
LNHPKGKRQNEYVTCRPSRPLRLHKDPILGLWVDPRSCLASRIPTVSPQYPHPCSSDLRPTVPFPPGNPVWSLISSKRHPPLFPNVGPFAYSNEKASHASPTKKMKNAHAFSRKGVASSAKNCQVRSEKPMRDNYPHA